MNWKRILGSILAIGIAGLFGTCYRVPKCNVRLRQLWRSILDFASGIDASLILMNGTTLILYVCFATDLFGLISNGIRTIRNYITGPREAVPPADTSALREEEDSDRHRRASLSLATPPPAQPNDDVSSAAPSTSEQRDHTSVEKRSSKTEGFTKATEGGSTPVSSRGSKSSHSIGSSSHGSRTSVTKGTKADLEFVEPGRRKLKIAMDEPKTPIRRARSDVAVKRIPSSCDIPSTQSDISIQVSHYNLRHPRTTSTSPAVTKSRGTTISDNSSAIMPPPPPPDTRAGPYFLRRRESQSLTPRRQSLTASDVGTPDSYPREEDLSHSSAQGRKEKQD